MKFFLYIIQDENGKMYIGQTSDLAKRMTEHSHKYQKSSKFVKDNGNFRLIYTEKFRSRLESMRREKQIKGWTRAKKQALINNDFELLKKL